MSTIVLTYILPLSPLLLVRSLSRRSFTTTLLTSPQLYSMIILPFVFLATAYSSVHARLDVARDVSVTLPVVSELNIARLGSVVQLDQSRAMALKQRLHASGQPHRRQSASVDVTNTAVSLPYTLFNFYHLMIHAGRLTSLSK